MGGYTRRMIKDIQSGEGQSNARILHSLLGTAR